MLLLVTVESTRVITGNPLINGFLIDISELLPKYCSVHFDARQWLF